MATDQTDIGSSPRVDTSSQVALSHGKLTIKGNEQHRWETWTPFSVQCPLLPSLTLPTWFWFPSLQPLFLGWGPHIKAATGLVLFCIWLSSLVIAQKLKRNFKGWQCLRNNTRGCPLTSMCAEHNIETHSYCHIYQHASLKAKYYIAV